MKCESDGLVYTSYPPKYKCKRCLKWWFCHDPIPECTDKEEKKMKYSIGDRVITKETGEKGVVVDVDTGDGVAYRVYHSGLSLFYSKYDLLTDLTAIEKPFGLLSEEVQKELKASEGNIQYYNGARWQDITQCLTLWFTHSAYRLAPNRKPSKPAFNMEVQPGEHFVIRCGCKPYLGKATAEGVSLVEVVE